MHANTAPKIDNMENLSNENLNENAQPKPEIEQKSEQKTEQIVEIIEKKLEIIKETKENFFKKFKNFFLDVAVVLIGVTLSTLLNDKISNYNQQKDVKKFLLGLKTDFSNDISEMEDDKLSFKQNARLFSFITRVKRNEIPSKDTIKNIGTEFLFNITGLIPNDGRYEGFKSAGKINTIENDSLQNDILDLYQEDLQTLLSSTNRHAESKRKLISYLEDNRIRETDSTTNLYKLLVAEKGYQICRSLENVNEIMDRYDICINKMKKISQAIENKYKND